MLSKVEKPDPLAVLTIASLLQEHREGRDPIVSYDAAARILPAIGRPLTPAQVRDLIVAVWVLGGRNVAPLSRFIAAADEVIAFRADRPNRKVAAAAKARAARTRGAV